LRENNRYFPRIVTEHVDTNSFFESSKPTNHTDNLTIFEVNELLREEERVEEMAARELQTIEDVAKTLFPKKFTAIKGKKHTYECGTCNAVEKRRCQQFVLTEE
jgi:hypothetical protein